MNLTRRKTAPRKPDPSRELSKTELALYSRKKYHNLSHVVFSAQIDLTYQVAKDFV